MDSLKKLQVLQRMVREVDEMLGQVIDELMAEQEDVEAQEIGAIPAEREASASKRRREEWYPLGFASQICTGRKPRELILPDGHRIPVDSWKMVFLLVLKDCNANPKYHDALMELRGNVNGRTRTLLGNSRKGMLTPEQLDRALYVETHGDAATLLRLLTRRILDVLGYDYSGIQVALRNT